MQLNKQQFAGFLGKDPEAKTFGDNKKVVNFSLAITEKFKEKEKTTWINCKAFGSLADVIEKYVKKGDNLYIETSLDVQNYEKDGVKRTSHSYIVRSLQFLTKKTQQNETNQSQSQPEQQEQSGDLPF